MLFIYDSDCGFCTNSVRRLAQYFPNVRWVPSSSIDKYGLNQIDVENAAWLIHDAGTRFRGARAFVGLIASRGGAWRILGRILSLRPLELVLDVTYGVIAANRHRFSRAGSCSLN